MDFSIARQSMVKSQIRPNQVNDPEVLAVMAELPRETFLPKVLQGVAYVDEDLPLGNGRYLMEPCVLARLLQAATIQSTDVALVIGCTTGYSAAVLARLASAVVAVESDAKLVQAATNTLAELGIDTVAVMQGELREGCPKQAPFDVIVLDGAVSEVPDALVTQLADGGRLVAAVRKNQAVGRGVLIKRRGDVIARRELFDATIPWLPGFEPAPGFVF